MAFEDVDLSEVAKESAFFRACVEGSAEELTKLLTENPKVVNTPTSDGIYPLMVIANRGDIDLAKLLLAHGADINADSLRLFF